MDTAYLLRNRAISPNTLHLQPFISGPKKGWVLINTHCDSASIYLLTGHSEYHLLTAVGKNHNILLVPGVW